MQAPFYVIPSWLHLLLNALSRCFAAVYRSLTLVSVIQLASLFIGFEHLTQHDCTLQEIALLMASSVLFKLGLRFSFTRVSLSAPLSE